MDQIKILQIISACALLAAIPATVWGYIFYRKQPEDRKYFMLTFGFGALAVFPILLYKFLWKFFPWMNIFEATKRYEDIGLGLAGFGLIPLSVILTFMFVGVIEEVMKQSSVHAVDDRKIRNIDDAIAFSIIAALGFSFTENILYFYNIWSAKGPEHILIPFVFRSIFSTFAHILFSGIFGYFYGLAHFAKPILQQELRDNRTTFWDIMHRIFRFKTASLFHEEKMFEGLFLAVGLHAIYNIFLEMNWTFLMVPYLVGGFILLSYLFKLKNNRKEFGLLYELERNNESEPRRVTKWFRKLVRRPGEI